MTLSEEDIERAVSRATAALLARRGEGGFWEGRLASSPLASAAALCALAGGNGTPDARLDRTAAYLARTQNADGGWGDTEISRSNLAATLLVLSADAIRRCLDEEQRGRARAFTEKLGGLAAGLRRAYGSDLTFQTPLRLAAAGANLLPWREVDALPFELALAPRRLLGALRLPMVSYALPALVCVGLARHSRAPSRCPPRRWLRELSAERALNLILKMQPASGGYLEAVPITAFCLMGLQAAGRGGHAVAQNARRFLWNTQRADGSWPVEVNLSVWNTTRALEALATAGGLERSLSLEERNKTRDWLLAQQTRGVSVYSDTRPGGWGWNHLPGSVPDADDTAGALLALRVLGTAPDHPACLAGAAWLRAVQNRDGGWPTFCRGWNKLPFDRSAPDLTAHALRALACESTASPALSAWKYLECVQRADGSFAPLWFGCEQAPDGVNLTYGTAQVLLSCAAEQGLPESEHGRHGRDARATKIAARARQWLLGIQNPDGGFGGCAGARSTAEETGLALRALVAGGVNFREECCTRAARWLLERQRADGSWDPAPIGFYFAVLWYYEELYPLCFALGGLGALARAGKG